MSLEEIREGLRLKWTDALRREERCGSEMSRNLPSSAENPLRGLR